MFDCPHCHKKTKNPAMKFEIRCGGCGATWSPTGEPRQTGAPEGTLGVPIVGEEYFGPGDVEMWGGLGIRRGNMIEL